MAMPLTKLAKKYSLAISPVMSVPHDLTCKIAPLPPHEQKTVHLGRAAFLHPAFCWRAAHQTRSKEENKLQHDVLIKFMILGPVNLLQVGFVQTSLLSGLARTSPNLVLPLQWSKHMNL